MCWLVSFQGKDEEQPEKNLLGVVGTDVRINDIVKLIPNYKVDLCTCLVWLEFRFTLLMLLSLFLVTR